MEIGTLLVARTVGIAPLVLAVAAGYGALVMSVTMFRTAPENGASRQTAPLDSVVQMPLRVRITELDADVRRAA